MLRPAHILQLTVLAMLGIGLVMTHSAGMSVGSNPATGLWAPFLSRNGIYAALAVTAMFLASRIDVRQIMRTRGVLNPIPWAIMISLGLVGAAMIPGIGRVVNGASRWLYLGPRSWGISFQPSELVKWVMVVAVAWWCTRRQGGINRLRVGILPPLLLVGVACVMIVAEDLGTAGLIGVVAMCLLLAGGARWWQLIMLAIPAVAGLGAAIFYSDYRRDRILAFLDPWADPRGVGYHPIQSMVAIAQGGLAGRGLGNGIQKFGYLPEDTTDFVFAIICEELGLAGAALVVCLYIMLLWIGLGVVRECRDGFGRLLGLGILLMIGLQATINIAVVTVVVPTKGIALPLISTGGTGWILTAFAVGLLASLDEANRLAAESGAVDLDLAVA